MGDAFGSLPGTCGATLGLYRFLGAQRIIHDSLQRCQASLRWLQAGRNLRRWDPKETRVSVGESRFFGFKVMERGKIARNTLFDFFDCLHPKLSKTYCVTYNDHYYDFLLSTFYSFLLPWFVGKRMIPRNNPPIFCRKPMVFALHFPFVSRLWSQLSAASCRCSQRFGATDVAKATWAFAKHLGVMWMWGQFGWWMDVPQNDGNPTWLDDKK